MYMKVWKNKSNGQLCVTIPKNSDVKEGEWVNINKKNIKKVVYSFVVGDLLHVGHINLLKIANDLGDLHICGVLTNKAAGSYKEEPIQTQKERSNIISHFDVVDMVMSQNERDPTNNLINIHQEFPKAKIILVHGDDWKDDPFPGEEYLKSIGGEVVKTPYYERLSTTKIREEIIKRGKK